MYSGHRSEEKYHLTFVFFTGCLEAPICTYVWKIHLSRKTLHFFSQSEWNNCFMAALCWNPGTSELRAIISTRQCDRHLITKVYKGTTGLQMSFFKSVCESGKQVTTSILKTRSPLLWWTDACWQDNFKATFRNVFWTISISFLNDQSIYLLIPN